MRLTVCILGTEVLSIETGQPEPEPEPEPELEPEQGEWHGSVTTSLADAGWADTGLGFTVPSMDGHG